MESPRHDLIMENDGQDARSDAGHHKTDLVTMDIGSSGTSERAESFHTALHEGIPEIYIDEITFSEATFEPRQRTESRSRISNEGRQRARSDQKMILEGRPRMKSDQRVIHEGRPRMQSDQRLVPEGRPRLASDRRYMDEGRSRTASDILIIENGEPRYDDNHALSEQSALVVEFILCMKHEPCRASATDLSLTSTESPSAWRHSVHCGGVILALGVQNVREIICTNIQTELQPTISTLNIDAIDSQDVRSELSFRVVLLQHVSIRGRLVSFPTSGPSENVSFSLDYICEGYRANVEPVASMHIDPNASRFEVLDHLARHSSEVLVQEFWWDHDELRPIMAAFRELDQWFRV
jgi:hypothetical protein